MNSSLPTKEHKFVKVVEFINKNLRYELTIRDITQGVFQKTLSNDQAVVANFLNIMFMLGLISKYLKEDKKTFYYRTYTKIKLNSELFKTEGNSTYRPVVINDNDQAG